MKECQIIYGNILRDVPCPFNYGVQTVAPPPGTRCMIGFRDDHEDSAYIIMFFNETNSQKNTINTVIETGVPRFMS